MPAAGRMARIFDLKAYPGVNAAIFDWEARMQGACAASLSAYFAGSFCRGYFQE
jgi:hypothetical protein